MKKAIISLMSTVLFLLGLNHTVSAAESFKDINSNHASWEEIEYLIERGVITGYQDGTFRPNTTVKRIQAITMLGRALNWETTNLADPGFSDVEKGTEGYRYLAVAVEKGIIQKGSTFNPYGTLTRAQMAKILANAFNLPAGPAKSFLDVKKDHWANEYIARLGFSNITTGYPNGTFKPENETTRMQFSLFISRALNPEFREEKAAFSGNSVKAASTIEYKNRIFTWCFDENEVGAMCSMDLDGNSPEIANLPEGELAVWGDRFYVNSFTDDQKIVSIKPDGTDEKTIVTAADIPVNMEKVWLGDMNITDEWIYFSVSSNKQYEGYIFKVKHDGSSLTQVHNKPTMSLTVSSNGLWFLEEYYNAWLTHIDFNGKKTSYDIHGVDFKIEEDWIYYLEEKNGDFSLYRMKLDGSQKELLAANVSPNSDFAIYNKGIHYVKNSSSGYFLYKNSLNGKNEQGVISLSGDLNIEAVFNNHVFYNFRSNDTFMLNLATLESTPISLHQYIEPEITTNSLVERLRQVVGEPYEVILGSDHPDRDAKVVKEDQPLMNVSVFEQELWFNIYDTSNETLEVVTDIMKSYETSIGDEEVTNSLKDSLNATETVYFQSGGMSYSVWPSNNESEAVKLVVVADLRSQGRPE